ncbi:osteoclast stimulating factor 1 [Thecamonas trahens ATCC 50062]|uniref:Osteoclast stimulating factor 1 n=1 Tax=Thecamonas trahens ATCC 50062 TaxID=461836 RepID=A0A0L0D9B6_THETB|nr:osteoclast stimulating factor 1 [Thecamonas trahens ATCC 50062]KNC48972.1 osteoclast stimulating factor 1 [Thecamonas trahens ATCC 50062]|eukprot:XP_013758387.1 osteoclast stimulating factor 1 [Thecamonas trahens ATCC 50062]
MLALWWLTVAIVAVVFVGGLVADGGVAADSPPNGPELFKDSIFVADAFSSISPLYSQPIPSRNPIMASDVSDGPGPSSSTEFYLDCSDSIVSFSLEVPYLTEVMRIEVIQENGGGPPVPPGLEPVGWTAHFAWDEPATFDNSGFSHSNTTSGWSETIVIPAPRAGRLFGMITIVDNYVTGGSGPYSCPGFDPSSYGFHPPGGEKAVQFAVTADLASCQFDGTSQTYSPYTDAGLSFDKIGSSDGCSEGMTRLVFGASATIAPSTAFTDPSESRTYAGVGSLSPPVGSMTYAYFVVTGAHARVDVDISGVSSATFGVDVWVRRDALAVPPSVFSGSTMTGAQDGLYVQHHPTSGPSVLTLFAPVPGVYFVGLHRTSLADFTLLVTSTPVADAIAPYKTGDGLVYIGFPDFPSLPASGSNLVVPSKQHGLLSGRRYPIQLAHATNGSSSFAVALFAFTVPAGAKAFDVEISASHPYDVVLRHGGPPVFSNSGVVQPDAMVVVSGVTDSFNSTTRLTKGIYYLAVIPAPGSPTDATFTGSIQVGWDLYCDSNCDGHGYCDIFGSTGTCSCWTEGDPSSGYFNQDRTGPHCKLAVCGRHGTCTGCVADPACTWCLSRGACLLGAVDAATGFNVAHSNSCPAQGGFAGVLASRLVTQPEVAEAKGDSRYGSCPAPYVHQTMATYLAGLPSTPPPPTLPPPPPFVTNFAQQRSGLGEWLDAGEYSETCGSVAYFYGPIPRAFAATYFDSNKFNTSFALCEFYSYNLATQAWSDLTSVMGDGETTGPGCRAHASLVCFPDDNQLVVIGGVVPNENIFGEYIRHRTDMWSLNLVSMTWTQIFPNCYDPHFTLRSRSATPKFVSTLPALCASSGLPLDWLSDERFGGIYPGTAAVRASDPVLRSKGILVAAAWSHVLSIADPLPTNLFDAVADVYFFNLTASPPVWQRLSFGSGTCPPTLGGSVVYSAPTASLVFDGGYFLGEVASISVSTTRGMTCVVAFSRSLTTGLVETTSRMPIETSAPQMHKLHTAGVALKDGRVLFAGGIGVGQYLNVMYRSSHMSAAGAHTSRTSYGLDVIFSPHDMSFSYLPERPAAMRWRAGAVLIRFPDGNVLELGGAVVSSASAVTGDDAPAMVFQLSHNAAVVAAAPNRATRAVGATLRHVPARGSVVLFGGVPKRVDPFDIGRLVAVDSDTSTKLSQVYEFDLASQSWALLATTGRDPTTLWLLGGSCIIDSTVYMFGGITIDNGLVAASDELWTLELNTGVWTRQTTFGTPPPALFGTGAVCTPDGSKMYVVSGLSDLRLLGSDDLIMLPTQIFSLDVGSMTWSVVPAPPVNFPFGLRPFIVPEAVAVATGRGNGELIGVVGPGLITSPTFFGIYGMVFLYNPSDGTWVEATPEENGKNRELPLWFLGSVSNARSDGTVLMFGGEAFEDQVVNSVLQLSLHDWSVRAVAHVPNTGTGSAVAAIEEASVAAHGDAYYFGGQQASDFDTPARVSGVLRRFDIGAAMAVEASSAMSGTFNVKNSLVLEGHGPGLEFNDLVCAYGDLRGDPATFVAPNRVLCNLPKAAVGQAMVRLLVGGTGLQSLSTGVSFTKLGCPPGTAGTQISVPCIPCGLGVYTDTYGEATCKLCPDTQYTPSVGSTTCASCSGGQYLAVDDGLARQCKPCPPGHYWPNATDEFAPSAVECTACAIDAYATEEGSTGCSKCPANSKIGTSGGDSADKCKCNDGFWGNLADGPCNECPQGGIATCEFLNNEVPVPNAGYWRDPENAGLVLECTPKSACPGGAASACATGYTGRACSRCTEGYYPLEDECEKCPDNTMAPMIIGGVALLIVIILFYKVAGKSTGKSSFTSISIAVNYFQTVALFSAYELNWPGAIVTIIKWFSIFNLSLDAASPECAVSVSYKTKWLISMSVPLVVGFVYGCYVLVRCMWSSLLSCCKEAPVEAAGAASSRASRYSSGLDTGKGKVEMDEEQEEGSDGVELLQRSGSAAGEAPRESKAVVAASCAACKVLSRSEIWSMANQMLHAYLMFLSFYYATMASKALELFACKKQTDGTYTLIAYPSMQCYSSAWWEVFPYALVAGFVFVAGLYALFAVILVKVFRPAFLSEEETLYERYLARFGFLTSRYALVWYGWELVVIGRKVALIAATLFFPQLPTLQGLTGMFIVFASVLTHVYARPFRNRRENRLEFVVLCVEYFLLFVGLVHSDQMDSASSTTLAVIGVTAIALSAALILVTVGMEVRLYYYSRRYREAAAEHPELSQRAEFVLTEEAYFELMSWVKNDGDEDECTELANVLEGMYFKTRALRKQHKVDVFVDEVQKTVSVYRETAPADDVEVLDGLIERITRRAIVKDQRTMKEKLLARPSNKVQPMQKLDGESSSVSAGPSSSPAAPGDGETTKLKSQPGSRVRSDSKSSRARTKTSRRRSSGARPRGEEPGRSASATRMDKKRPLLATQGSDPEVMGAASGAAARSSATRMEKRRSVSTSLTQTQPNLAFVRDAGLNSSQPQAAGSLKKRRRSSSRRRSHANIVRADCISMSLDEATAAEPQTDRPTNCTYLNVAQAKVCMVCQSKYTPKACKHDYQHTSPLDEEWMTAACAGCGVQAPLPQAEETVDAGVAAAEAAEAADAPNAAWVCLVCYQVVCAECRGAHADATDHFLYMARDDGSLFCTACDDAIEDADGTFWFVLGLRRQRVDDAVDRALEMPELVLEPEAPAAGSDDASGAGRATAASKAVESVEDAGPGAGAGAGAGTDADSAAYPDAAAAIFDSGWTEVHTAAKLGDYGKTKQALDVNPEAIHGIHEPDGWTPLYFAAHGGFPDVAKLLIDAGSSVNYQCLRYGWTPLHAAAQGGCVEVAEMLVAAGSDVELKNNSGVTAIELCEDAEMKVHLQAFVESVQSAGEA